MKRIAITPKVIVGSAGSAHPMTSLTESQAAEVLWLFYRDRKAELIADIRLYRDNILAQLMQGRPAQEVFAPYAKPGAKAE